jgi:Fur family ferric uptake transcriptional regulator
MELARSAPAIRPAPLDAALATVRARGLRASLSRRVLLTALAAAERPVTAEAIARGLDGRVPPTDIGSVYRNLDALAGIGIVRRLQACHGAALYTLADPDAAGYLSCVRCGRVQPVARPAVAAVSAVVLAAMGWEASFTEVPIAGLCPGCAREEERCDGSRAH